MEIIKEVLEKLENGYNLWIPTENSCDDKWVSYSDKHFWLETQNCYSDTCKCVSHDKYTKEEITFEEALEYLKLIVTAEEKKQAKEEQNEKFWKNLKEFYDSCK